MATGLAPSESGVLPSGALPKSAGKVVDYDKFIDTQLRRTRGQVKIVEIAGGLMTLALAAVAFFLVAAVLDHWIIPHGLGIWGRVLFCIAFVAGVSYFLATAVVPALFGRVNPIYAAQAIERSKPSLKNSLINFLLFRPRRETLSPVVYRALEEQAATGITNLPAETAVDRTRLIHIGYALIALVGAFAIYFIVSPKNPFTTAARVIVPWADLQAPARVTIRDIQPGNATAFRGQPVKVSAEIEGLASDDEVLMIYSTADRQVVDRAVAMHLPTDSYRHVATLPEGDLGVQQNMEYRIEAGDARSDTYRIEATAAPVIVVESVDYKYPAYTGIEPSTVKNRGDLKALEGTEVTIKATANQPIKSASIDFACDGKQDRSLKVSGQSATITFTLAMNEARTGPLVDSYQLRFVNPQQIENPKPVRHRIEVTPDLPPEVQILVPEQEEVAVPLNSAVTLEVKAIDPDFALGGVKLRAKTERGEVLDQSLLADAPHRGPFVGKYDFSPEKLKLNVGDVVRYRATAADNKTPEPSEAISPEKRIRVVEPDPIKPRHQQEQPQQDDPQQNPPQDGKQQDGKQQDGKQQDGKQQDGKQQDGKQQDGKQQDGKQQDGKADQQGSADPSQGNPQGDGQPAGNQQNQSNQRGEQSGRPNDSQQNDSQDNSPVPSSGADDGRGLEKILQHRNEQQPQDQNQGQPNQQPGDPANQQPGDAAKQPPDDAAKQQPGGDRQDGQKQSPDQQPMPGQDPQGNSDAAGQNPQQGQPAGDREQPGEKSPGDQPQPGQPPQDQPDAEKKPGEQRPGEQPPGGQQKTEPSGDQPAGQQPSEQNPAGDPKQQPSGQQPSGKTPSGQQPQASDPQQQPSGPKQSSQNRQDKDGEQSGDDKPQKQPQTGDKQQQEQQQQKSPDAASQNKQGNPGAGQESKEGDNPPDTQQQAKSKNDKQPDNSQNQTKQGEGQSSSVSPHESKSKGDQEGSFSGGGAKGGGQDGGKAGKGSAGKNTSAEEGSGQSNERGKGEKSDQPGGDQQSEKPTGQAGNKRGEGSTTRQSNDADKSSGNQNKEPSQAKQDDAKGQQNNQQANQEQNNDQPQANKPDKADQQKPKPNDYPEEQKSGPSQGGANSAGGDATGAGTPPPGAPIKPDEANLEYAKKATELALDHLKNSLKKGGKDANDLLNQLGWSPDEAQQFIDRQQRRLQSVKRPNPNDADRREAEDALRSLGLRPPRTDRSGSDLTSDKGRGLSSGRRTAPPPEYAEQYKAYSQGINRASGR